MSDALALPKYQVVYRGGHFRYIWSLNPLLSAINPLLRDLSGGVTSGCISSAQKTIEIMNDREKMNQGTYQAKGTSPLGCMT